jgi:DNA mismatch repair protein MutL
VLEPGRYPVGVVYVEVPLDQVDVNVHPQKAEVRFSEGRALYDAVTRELHLALSRAFNVPALGAGRPWAAPRPPPSSSEVATPRFVREMGGEGDATPKDPWGLAGDREERGTLESLAERTTLESVPDAVLVPPDVSAPAGLFEGHGFYGSLEFLAQVRATFLVCSGADGLYVLDQHAAAERVTFHRLRKAFDARTMTTQRLLIPDLVELLPTEVATLEENAKAVEALGVELRPVGSGAVAVHAVPTLLVRSRPERIVRDLVAELGRAARRPFGDTADMVLATMACHGSIRAGDVVTREEAASLLRALDDIDFAGHCPHGRPVVTRIGYDELERRVGR